VPAATLVGYLVNPSNPSAEIYVKEAETTASTLGIAIRVLNASAVAELDEVFASFQNETSPMTAPRLSCPTT
jgi:ABC-type uncharacterized transport system substrate-binding protein